MNSDLNLFLYSEDLVEGRAYSIRLGSYGKLFSRSLSSYNIGVYHEVGGEIIFNEGLFKRIYVSRDFYFHFKADINNKMEWKCSPYPPRGSWAIAHQDSGAVAFTEESKAIAIATGIDYGEFFSDNPELAGKLKHLITAEKKEYGNQSIFSVAQRIEEAGADPSKTKLIKVNEKSQIYAFTLKEDESIPSLRFTDYFTPITPHISFIESFLAEKGQKEGEKEDCVIQ